jgi:hypothetical protein
MLRGLATALGLVPCAFVGTAQAVDVTVDPATLNLGFMNVYNLPAPDGDGVFQFASGWGFADLTASYSGANLTLGPNTIGDPNEYWYQCTGGATPPNCGGPGAPGNKIMEANGYAQVDDGSLSGVTVNFVGNVISNTLTSAHTATAFIRDFAPDFSSFNETTIALPVSGSFNISLATTNDPARHVQYGFQMVGVNVWVTDTAPFGSVTIGPDGPPDTAGSSWGRVTTMYR